MIHSIQIHVCTQDKENMKKKKYTHIFSVFWAMYMICCNILREYATEKECVKERYLHAKAIIRLIKHCEAM